MSNLIDLTGKKIGRWTVLEYVGGKRSLWNCLCDCGTKKLVGGAGLRSGDSKGCYECNPRVTHLEGKRFGKWTILKRVEHRFGAWLCECDCGTAGVVTTSNLKRGYSTCCADCAKRKKRKGFTLKSTAIYKIWCNVRAYGSDRVCEEWLTSFEAFKEFADKTGYREGLYLNRSDILKKYSPDNCVWSNRKVNFLVGRQTAIYSTPDGSMTRAMIAETLGISRQAVAQRLQKCKSIGCLVRKKSSEKGSKHGRSSTSKFIRRFGLNLEELAEVLNIEPYNLSRWLSLPKKELKELYERQFNRCLKVRSVIELLKEPE